MRVAALLLLGCGVLSAQPAAIDGTVVNEASGQPLAGVHVRVFALSGDGSIGSAYGAISDPAGHFSIASIQAGTYVVLAERTAFVAVLKKSGPIPIVTVTLKAGQKLTDYKLTMTPRAVIKGRVLDAYGDPMPNVSVHVEPAEKDGLPGPGVDEEYAEAAENIEFHPDDKLTRDLKLYTGATK